MRRNTIDFVKDVIWVGDSREQVRSFPKTSRVKIGEALRVAQGGGKHPKAKPLRTVGSGVLEIVVPYDTNTYRAIYTVNIGDNIYVLHAFQKKSTSGISTPKKEIDLIKRRLKIVLDLEKSNE